MRARTLLPGLAPLVCLLLAGPASAASFTVNSTGDGGDAAPGNGTCATGGGLCTLRAAVQEANALAGTDSATVPARHDHARVVADASPPPLTITGAGSQTGQTLIDAAGHQGFFVDADGVALRQLALTGGDAQGGGGVQVDDGATLEIADARLFDNTATTGGGALAIDADATVTVLRTTMDGNSAIGGFGGAVWNAGSMFAHESLFAENESLRAGAIRNVGGAVLNLRNSTVSGNSVDPVHQRGRGRHRDRRGQLRVPQQRHDLRQPRRGGDRRQHRRRRDLHLGRLHDRGQEQHHRRERRPVRARRLRRSRELRQPLQPARGHGRLRPAGGDLDMGARGGP